MKKNLLILALFVSGFLSAQEELKINITDALALKTLNVSYEHYFDEQTTLGVSGLFNFENESSDFRYNEDLVITPFVRHYFSTESLWNFFGEFFFSYSKGDEETNSTVIDYTGGALGLAVGYKYISPGGFTVDAHLGAGRYLFGENTPTLIPRIGVNIGYQF
ncbi:MAG: DUF3575 domain-containing protein [Flavobacteriaceae bacterium]|nr:DUF3575 domain-containing protein [Flavobacteriaceae bacterium]